MSADAKIELPELLSPAEIKKDQDGIRRTLTKLDAQIHANAIQCMLHCEKHRDTSLMRRLLVDIIDAKSGYRRQGLIAWMRQYSPMELSGDTINLSGMKDGKERPFDVQKAAETPFWSLTREIAVVRPIYQESVLNKIEAAVREFKKAYENTGEDGKPKDASKPFYDGTHLDKVVDFFEQVEKLKGTIPADATREVRQAQETLRMAEAKEAAAKRA